MWSDCFIFGSFTTHVESSKSHSTRVTVLKDKLFPPKDLYASLGDTTNYKIDSVAVMQEML